MEEIILNSIKEKEDEILKLKNTIIDTNNEIIRLHEEIYKNTNNDLKDIILFSLYLFIAIIIYSII
jgi:hypothetical protein